MDSIDSRPEIRNSKLLWLILGVFLIPLFNAIEVLGAGLLKVMGFPIFGRLVMAATFQTITVLGLFAFLFWMIKNWKAENSGMVLTLKDFKIYGIIFLVVIIAGRVVSIFVLKKISEEIRALQDSVDYDVLKNLTYWSLAGSVLTTLREIILFVIYFVVILKNKSVNAVVTS